jgi:hypothetical protein
MKKIILCYVVLTLVAFLSCKKNDEPAPKSPDGARTYSGIVNTTINKTRASGSPSTLQPINESNSKILTVSITTSNGNYYLDGNLMSGGTNTYTLSANSANYVFNLSSKEVQYSYSKSWQEWVRVGVGNFLYDVKENASGVLK